jgi:transposase-like protein
MAKGKNFSEQHRVSKVKEFLASGLTANEFCRRQGIPNSTFSLWRKWLAPQLPSFVLDRCACRVGGAIVFNLPQSPVSVFSLPLNH